MAGSDGNGGGGGRAVWWIIGLLTSLLIIAATTFAAHVEATLAAHGATLAGRGERLTALERDVAALYLRVGRLEREPAGGG